MLELSVIPTSSSETQATNDSVPQRRHSAEYVVLDNRDLLGGVDGRVAQILSCLLSATKLRGRADDGRQRRQDDVADVDRDDPRLVRCGEVPTKKLMIAAYELIGERIWRSDDRGGWVERDEGGFTIADRVCA